MLNQGKISTIMLSLNTYLRGLTMFNRKETRKEYHIFSTDVSFGTLEKDPRTFIRSFLQYLKDNPMRREPYETCAAARSRVTRIDALGHEYIFIIVARAVPPTQPLEMTDFYQVLIADMRFLCDGFKMPWGHVLKYFETKDNFETYHVRREPLSGMHGGVLAILQHREQYLKNGFDLNLTSDPIKEVTSTSSLTKGC